MPTILLIRHAENDYLKKKRLAGQTPGVHLNKAGQAQAQALAEKLAQAPIKAIYSSPLERAIETAEPLAHKLGLEIIPRQGLLETDCGEWTGASVPRLRRLKAWKLVQGSPSLFRFPGGESFADTQCRMVQEIEAMRLAHDPKDLLACFGHADPLRLVVAYYLGLPLDNFQRLGLSPASVTVLHIDQSSAHLLNLNAGPGFSLPG